MRNLGWFKYCGVIQCKHAIILIDFHLYLWCFSNCEKTHFGPLGGRLGKDWIYHRSAARQTTENIIRIAQNCSLKVVELVNLLILARFFKVKLSSAKMLIKARPTKSHIDRIVGFQFWWETSAGFKYFGVIRCPKAVVLIDFHLYLWCFSNSDKTHFGPLGGRLGNNKIEHRNAARQTTENIIRIAQNGSVKVVQMVSV